MTGRWRSSHARVTRLPTRSQIGSVDYAEFDARPRAPIPAWTDTARRTGGDYSTQLSAESALSGSFLGWDPPPPQSMPLWQLLQSIALPVEPIVPVGSYREPFLTPVEIRTLGEPRSGDRDCSICLLEYKIPSCGNGNSTTQAPAAPLLPSFGAAPASPQIGTPAAANPAPVAGSMPEVLPTADEAPVRLPCGHVMGETCIRNWLRTINFCAYCRARVYCRPLPQIVNMRDKMRQ